MTLNPFGRGLQRKWRRTNTKHSTRPSPGWVDLCFTHKESTLMILSGFLDQFKWNHFSFSGHWWALVSHSLHRWRRSHLQVNPLYPCICTQRPFRWVWNQEKWLHQGNWESLCGILLCCIWVNNCTQFGSFSYLCVESSSPMTSMTWCPSTSTSSKAL